MPVEFFGRFPFGRPNSVRPMRVPDGAAKALVVGVYPSAFHVSWTPPPDRDVRDLSARRGPIVRSLAVDVEPVVFWDGAKPDPHVLLERWKRDVQFDPDVHGSVTVGHNGPSGVGLVDRILEPLGLGPDEVAYTDVLPWYFIKDGAGGQGEAIRKWFEPFARKHGLPESSLPRRPTPRQLVKLVQSDERRASLRRELAEAAAPLIITLGKEALDGVRAVADDSSGVQAKLGPQDYGKRGRIAIGGSEFDLLPLVHPGFQRQTKNGDWVEALGDWAGLERTWTTFADAEVRLEGGHALAGVGASDLPADLMWVVTAENPFGKLVNSADNAAATRRLVADLPSGVQWLAARGGGGEHWEASIVLGAGASRELALQLGRSYGQLAIFELTHTEQRLLDCATGEVVRRRTRLR